MSEPRSRKPIAALVLSAAAVVGISRHEGFRSTAYLPTPDDVPTIGYGTTEGVKMGDTITKERALVRLSRDADMFARAVKRCAPVPMFQNEFDAYTSLTYNIGESAFCKSTIAKRLKAGDYYGACRGILAWDKQAGRQLKGLTNRRQAEYKLCIQS
jgi:lysozyme